MVLGETEIFGQVKKAYAIAQETGTTARRMNKLFQQSFSVGKLVRSNSSIQQGSTRSAPPPSISPRRSSANSTAAAS